MAQPRPLGGPGRAPQLADRRGGRPVDGIEPALRPGVPLGRRTGDATADLRPAHAPPPLADDDDRGGGPLFPLLLAPLPGALAGRREEDDDDAETAAERLSGYEPSPRHAPTRRSGGSTSATPLATQPLATVAAANVCPALDAAGAGSLEEDDELPSSPIHPFALDLQLPSPLLGAGDDEADEGRRRGRGPRAAAGSEDAPTSPLHPHGLPLYTFPIMEDDASSPGPPPRRASWGGGSGARTALFRQPGFSTVIALDQQQRGEASPRTSGGPDVSSGPADDGEQVHALGGWGSSRRSMSRRTSTSSLIGDGGASDGGDGISLPSTPTFHHAQQLNPISLDTSNISSVTVSCSGTGLGIILTRCTKELIIPAAFVSHINPGGAVARCGRVFVGDIVVRIAGRSLVGLPFSDMVAIARDAGAAQGDIAVDVIHQQTVYEFDFQRGEDEPLGMVMIGSLISTVRPGSTADRAGIPACHYIIRVNSQNTAGFSTAQMVACLLSKRRIRMQTMPAYIYETIHT